MVRTFDDDPLYVQDRKRFEAEKSEMSVAFRDLQSELIELRTQLQDSEQERSSTINELGDTKATVVSDSKLLAPWLICEEICYKVDEGLITSRTEVNRSCSFFQDKLSQQLAEVQRAATPVEPQRNGHQSEESAATSPTPNAQQNGGNHDGVSASKLEATVQCLVDNDVDGVVGAMLNMSLGSDARD